MDEVTGDEDASKDEIFGSKPVILCIIGPTGEEKIPPTLREEKKVDKDMISDRCSK
ncbi:hypothetical protein BofuT4_uP060730.1 [Botrytis cinerea T4]|uniref:Uncharacterized protein n=1 Tax=Botryotinia fuckeliana (strain T4) TaxID=999810 RepID=G2XU55_BOTF4|nr:hypothetical protein BofuT4_uP060730.1 [Botrytis cinerea T4]